MRLSCGPANEFFKDVAEHTMDILDAARRYGDGKMTMKQAYDKACELHPQIGPILQARANAKASAERRAAAASVSGTPGGDSTPPPPTDTRSILENMFDEAGRI